MTLVLFALPRAPDRPYNCDICYNHTTRIRFWGFVSCIVKLADLAGGRDARLMQLTDMVSGHTHHWARR